MDGIVVRYAYDGDEDAWQRAVDGFLGAVAGMALQAGRRTG